MGAECAKEGHLGKTSGFLSSKRLKSMWCRPVYARLEKLHPPHDSDPSGQWGKTMHLYLCLKISPWPFLQGLQRFDSPDLDETWLQWFWGWCTPSSWWGPWMCRGSHRLNICLESRWRFTRYWRQSFSIEQEEVFSKFFLKVEPVNETKMASLHFEFEFVQCTFDKTSGMPCLHFCLQRSQGVELAWGRCSFDQQRKWLWREVFAQDCTRLGPAQGWVYWWGFEVTHEWLRANSSFCRQRLQGQGLDQYGQVRLWPCYINWKIVRTSVREGIFKGHMHRGRGSWGDSELAYGAHGASRISSP